MQVHKSGWRRAPFAYFPKNSRTAKFFSTKSGYQMCFKIAALILLVFLAELVPGANMWPWSRKKDSRVFVKGTGSTLTIQPGDTVITGIFPNRKFTRPIYRWFYAVNDHQVIHFLPKWNRVFKTVKPVLHDVPREFAKTKLVNRGKKSGHIGPVGSLIAALMLEHGVEFPFNLFFCNCKHFVEYLSLGMVKGHWYRPLYNRMSKKCPLAAKLTAGMKDDIHREKAFTLKNRKGDTWPMKVAQWPSYVPKHLFGHSP